MKMLLCTDGSDTADKALDYAIRSAKSIRDRFFDRLKSNLQCPPAKRGRR